MQHLNEDLNLVKYEGSSKKAEKKKKEVQTKLVKEHSFAGLVSLLRLAARVLGQPLYRQVGDLIAAAKATKDIADDIVELFKNDDVKRKIKGLIKTIGNWRLPFKFQNLVTRQLSLMLDYTEASLETDKKNEERLRPEFEKLITEENARWSGSTINTFNKIKILDTDSIEEALYTYIEKNVNERLNL